VSSCTTEDRELVPGTKIARSRSSRVRAAVLILVHVAIAAHIAHWYSKGETMTPLEPSEAMEFSKHSIVNAGLVFFLLATVLTAIFGRFFCGWGCHIVALQDLCRWLLLKVGIRPKPLRSRALLFVPAIAFVYMFLWPVAYRLWIGDDFSHRGTEWTTAGFWDTFPPWPVAALTFAVCGFGAVYFLGAKGFCTYACPYGALFGLVDKIAPGRIRVTDACEGCGHCTATCSSNVQVAAEVRDYGQVVDPACMKCLDCVSVCPKDALYFGFGKVARAPRPDRPAHAKGAVIAAKKLARWKDLSLGEEALIALLFVAAFLTFRGLYGAVPFLFALGLAATLAFIGLLTVRMLTKESVRLQTSVLKSSGALTGSGRTFLGCSLVLGLFWTHSAVIQVKEDSAANAFAATGPLRAAWTPLSEPMLSSQSEALLGELESDASFLDRWALIPSANNARRLAWIALLRGDEDGYTDLLQRAIELEPTRTDSTVDLFRFLLNSRRDPEAAEAILREGLVRCGEDGQLLYLLGVLRASAGDPESAAELFQRSLDADPHSLRARENLAGMLCELGRFEEGVRHFELALQEREDADTRVLLTRALLGLGRYEEARTHAAVAAELVPESPVPWELMADCARGLGHEGDAARCLEEARSRRLEEPR
jgi:polyferredoxin/Flp pilus assembly protein TadD